MNALEPLLAKRSNHASKIAHKIYIDVPPSILAPLGEVYSGKVSLRSKRTIITIARIIIIAPLKVNPSSLAKVEMPNEVNSFLSIKISSFVLLARKNIQAKQTRQNVMPVRNIRVIGLLVSMPIDL